MSLPPIYLSENKTKQQNQPQLREYLEAESLVFVLWYLNKLTGSHLWPSFLIRSFFFSNPLTSSGWTVSFWLCPVLSMLAQEPSRMPGWCLHTICFSKIGICFSHNYVQLFPSTEQSLLLYSCLAPRLEFVFIVYLERCLPVCQFPLVFLYNLF